MNYIEIEKENVINGPGLRVVLWVSGCSHHCERCQNPETWDYNFGKPFTEKEEQEITDELLKNYISGITFSGGDPLYSENLDGILKLILKIKNDVPSKSIWLYTGYTFEEILSNSKMLKIVSLCDVVIDGEYIEEKRNIALRFCGSSNQRVIDVQKSLKENKVVLWES